jgi:hypothetical protein
VRIKFGCPLRILGVALRMLAAVKLDYEARMLTAKIHYIGSDWYLATKFQAAKSTITQPKP